MWPRIRFKTRPMELTLQNGVLQLRVPGDLGAVTSATVTRGTSGVECPCALKDWDKDYMQPVLRSLYRELSTPR